MDVDICILNVLLYRPGVFTEDVSTVPEKERRPPEENGKNQAR